MGQVLTLKVTDLKYFKIVIVWVCVFMAVPVRGQNEICQDRDGLRQIASNSEVRTGLFYFGTYWSSGTDIHINSGVQNYWFYLLAEGGAGINDNGYEYQVHGIGRERAAQIAYWNMVYYMNSSCGYGDARVGSIMAAALLFGYDSEEVRSTIDAWNAVGVNTLGNLQYDFETVPCES